jgi:hypothetical protein
MDAMRGAAAQVERIPRGGRGKGHDATVRDILPWHEVRARLEERGVVFDDVPSNDDEPPRGPSSGVQISERHPVVDALEDNVSFKVYTLAELDRRMRDTPASFVRPSVGVIVEKGPSPWPRAGAALLALATTFKAWLLLGSGRPALGDALRAPSVVLDLELRAAIRTVEWKRVGMFGGAGLATAFALLFIVLTVAELTDDLKPARASGSTSLVSSSGESEPVSATTTTLATLAPEPSAAAVAPASTFVDELDGPAPVAAVKAPKAAKAPKARGAKPAKKPGKKSAEAFIP